MPLARETKLNTTGPVHKSDVLKYITSVLEKAKQDLIKAEKVESEAQIERRKKKIKEMEATLILEKQREQNKGK